MTTGRSWEDVKREAHRRSPALDDPDLQAAAEARLDAYVAGYRLRELRKAAGLTQKDLARLMRVTQSRISQIETGRVEAMELETLRAYVAALGGHVDVTVHVGPHSVRVA